MMLYISEFFIFPFAQLLCAEAPCSLSSPDLRVMSVQRSMRPNVSLTPSHAVCFFSLFLSSGPRSARTGHVLCASCCSAIVEKTTPRLQPACPFCRESFSPDSVRLIRMDFTTSGWSTPRRYPHFEPGSDFIGELLAKRTEHLLRFDPDPRSKSEARRLEDKVARIAAKKCSVEEVSALQKELEDWLKTAKDDQQHSALFLSAALLRAILMNHLVHSEASRTAKSNELALKSKIENLEFMHHALDVQHNRCVRNFSLLVLPLISTLFNS